MEKLSGGAGRMKDGGDELFGINRDFYGKFAIDFINRRRMKKAEGRPQIMGRTAGNTAGIVLLWRGFVEMNVGDGAEKTQQ